VTRQQADSYARALAGVAEGRVVALARHFKTPVVADPGGAWFAYALVAKKQLVFRRPNGSLLRTVRLAFVPEVVAAAGKGGRINYPHGSY